MAEELNPGGSIVPLLGRMNLEHERRYTFAREYVPTGSCVDFGCGFGIGSYFLAEGREEPVLGLDVDEHAIQFARSHFSRPNLTFEIAAGGSIPAASGSLSLLTCFEVIEHLRPHQLESFLKEAHRVIRTGGFVVGSTPNGLSRKPNSNPFHVQEFSAEQLVSLAKTHDFSAVVCSQGSLEPGESSGVARLFEKIPAALSSSGLFRVLFSLATSTSGYSQRAKRQAVISRDGDLRNGRTLVFVFSLTGPV